MAKMVDELSETIGLESLEEIEVMRDVVNPIVEKVFGVALNDVAQITGWDSRLIDALSFGIGECTSFLMTRSFRAGQL